jgi:hypothetical protein
MACNWAIRVLYDLLSHTQATIAPRVKELSDQLVTHLNNTGE